MPKVTICGGGNAAHVLVALAAKAGWEVDLFAPLADETERLQRGVARQGGITARFDHQTITGAPHRISSDPGQVIPNAELVLLAVPAFAHGPLLKAIAGWLEPGVALGALPARGGFDYQLSSLLPTKAREVSFFGLQTLPWACRIVSYGQSVEVLGTKATVDLAAVPVEEAPRLAEQLTALLGVRVNPVASFLSLTLANTGQLIHPGIMYGLCRGRERATFPAAGMPLFYQGVDQPTADLLQALSDEVQRLAKGLAFLPHFDPQQIPSLHQWLLRSYPTNIKDGSDLHTAFVTNQAYTGLRVPGRAIGPDTFAIDYQARYLAEDVPYGLVVVRGIAQLAGIATPTIDTVITWAQARLDRQYLANGTLSGSDLPDTRAPQLYGLNTLEQLVRMT